MWVPGGPILFFIQTSEERDKKKTCPMLTVYVTDSPKIAIHVSIGKINFFYSLLGLEAFSFDYVVKWPVSLILSKKV